MREAYRPTMHGGYRVKAIAIYYMYYCNSTLMSQIHVMYYLHIVNLSFLGTLARPSSTRSAHLDPTSFSGSTDPRYWAQNVSYLILCAMLFLIGEIFPLWNATYASPNSLCTRVIRTYRRRVKCPYLLVYDPL